MLWTICAATSIARRRSSSFRVGFRLQGVMMIIESVSSHSSSECVAHKPASVLTCCAAIWISRHSRRSAAPNPCGIKVLHQVDTAPASGSASASLPFPCFQEMSESIDQLIMTGRQVPIFIQVADDELGSDLQLRLQSQCSQLPRQVIGKSSRLRKKVLERRLLAVFIFRLGAIARIKILLKVRPEINLVERVFGLSRWRPSSASSRSGGCRSCSCRLATSSSIGTDSSISSRTGFSTISASIISFSSSLLSARTLTICIRPGVRTWRCDTFKFNLGCNNAIRGTRFPDDYH